MQNQFAGPEGLFSAIVASSLPANLMNVSANSRNVGVAKMS
jgi:hypothetical protein